MSAHHRRSTLSVLALLLTLPACDLVDGVRARTAHPDTLAAVAMGSGLLLGLQVPGALAAGEEAVVRLSVTNRSDTIASRIRIELVVPGWLDPMPPRAGDREVAMVAIDGATRFAYRMDDTPLEPNQTQTIEQRIRVPALDPQTEGALPRTRLVRARLLGPDDEPLAEVESEIALEGVPLRDPIPPADTANHRDQLGSVRLGMTTAALRQAAPAARDTTWSLSGAAHRAVAFPVGPNGRAFAVLSGDTVVHIEVRDPGVRTREQIGVGSRMEELRAAYGAACADTDEGTVVVWFARAPGISFALDTPVPEDPALLRQNPARIPGAAPVTRWWLRRGSDPCPR
jgi:hypothetical protein